MNCRKMGLICYLSEEELNNAIVNCACDFYAYILHDKDLWEEDNVDSNGVIINEKGTLKKEHFHVYLKFENAHSTNKVSRIFGVSENLVECIDYESSYLRYFTHENKNTEGVFVYSDSDIKSNIGNLMELLKDKQDYLSYCYDLLLDYLCSNIEELPCLTECIVYLNNKGCSSYSSRYFYLIKCVLNDFKNCSSIDLLKKIPKGLRQ